MARLPVQRNRGGCSPWTLMGCGCGLLAGIGIMLVFVILGVQWVHARTDPRWNRQAYAQCQANVYNLAKALESYRQDYHHLPARLDELRTLNYLDQSSRLHCPLDSQELGTSYEYYPQATRPTDPLLICRNHGQGVIVLQRDGRIRLPKVLRR